MRHADQIRMRARELARSGMHADCLAIVRQLEDEGYESIAPALQDPPYGTFSKALREILARRACERCRL